MRNHQIYLSGPMSGIDEHNHPAFMRWAKRLRALGVEVFNPAHNGLDPNAQWQEHMRADLTALVRSEHVALLPGWQRSRGAGIEARLAQDLGMEALPVQQWVRQHMQRQGRGGEAFDAELGAAAAKVIRAIDLAAEGRVSEVEALTPDAQGRPRLGLQTLYRDFVMTLREFGWRSAFDDKAVADLPQPERPLCPEVFDRLPHLKTLLEDLRECAWTMDQIEIEVCRPAA